MRARVPLVRIILMAVALTVMASCAYAPRVAEENDDILSIRDDYIRTHPDGSYNEFILRGEVVKGMKYLEVLASWGYPEARLRVPERKLEYWRYLARDEASRDWLQYTFIFEKDELIEWEMTRHVSKGRAMADIEFDDPTVPPSPAEALPEPRTSLKH
jgi:hypothetical protein